LLKHGCMPLDVALHQHFENTSDRIEPLFGSVDKAWQELRQAIVSERVILRGTPYNKGQHINAFGREEDFSVELDVYPVKHCYRVDSQLAARLVLDICPDQFRLRPDDWFTAGGWWWRDVETDWAKVASNFPARSGGGSAEPILNVTGGPIVPEGAANSSEEVPRSVPSQDSYKLDEAALANILPTRVDILRAFVKLRIKRGLPYRNKVARDRDIQEYFNPNSKERITSPSRETIDRAFEDYEIATGQALMRIAVFCRD